MTAPMRTLTSAGLVGGTGLSGTVLVAQTETILPYYGFLPAGSIISGTTAAATNNNPSTFIRYHIVGTNGYIGGADTDTVVWKLYWGTTPGVSGTAVFNTALEFVQPMGAFGASTWALDVELSSWNNAATSVAACRVSYVARYNYATVVSPLATTADQIRMAVGNSDLINNTADIYLWWTVTGGTVGGAGGATAYNPKTFYAWIGGEPRFL